MEAPRCPMESMERYGESFKKRVKAKEIGERMFPLLISSMIVLPVIMVLVNHGVLWPLVAVPVGLLVTLLWSYARKKHWGKQERLLQAQVREDIIEAFHLDLSGQDERKGPTAGA